jgi:hypothetical protein
MINSKTLNEVIEKFKKNPIYLENGAGSLARKWNTTEEVVKLAKKIYRDSNLLNKSPQNAIIPKLGKLIPLSEQKTEFNNVETGERNVEFTSNKPLSKEEIEQKFSVDNITTKLSNYWNKEIGDGKYRVSAFIKVLNELSSTDLEQKLKEILPQVQAKKLPVVTADINDNLLIYVSDIHAGATDIKKCVHDIEYNEQIMTDRLLSVVKEALAKSKKYNHVFILNLGDSLNSWSGETTRKGHHVASESNEEMFDIFVRGLSTFYTTLFESGLGKNYTVWNCLDSNHDGNGASYVANKAVELFISGRYPEVKFVQQKEFIQTISIGNHTFAFTHGKDSHVMKYPMKMILDDKLDSWFQQYFNQNGFLTTSTWCHLRKGDLHQYNHQFGKFGDYMNVPSIYGTSEYISINFGNSAAGAVLEEFNAKKAHTTITPIFFGK